MQSLTDNRRLRDETFAYLKPLADESANNRVELAKLQAELKCCCEKQELREQIVLGKVNELALTTQAKFGCLDGTIANMMGTTVEYLGFKFDKSDGEALINIMEKYKDD